MPDSLPETLSDLAWIVFTADYHPDDIANGAARGRWDNPALIRDRQKAERTAQRIADALNVADLASQRDSLIHALRLLGYPWSDEMWRNVGDDAPANQQACVEYRAAHRAVSAVLSRTSLLSPTGPGAVSVVEVTDAMVDAALSEAGSAWGDHLQGGPIKRKLMRAALEAALSAARLALPAPVGGSTPSATAAEAFHAVTDKQVEAAYWAIEEQAKKLMPAEYTFPTRDEVLDGCDNMRIALEAAYRVQPPTLSPTPPDDRTGYVLVPIEPDDGMIEAGQEVIVEGRNWGKTLYASDIYEAMLAASPARTPDDRTGETGGWRPIDTAPIGSEVLLGRSGVKHQAVGTRGTRGEFWDWPYTAAPTHWRPLDAPPPAPAPAERGGEA